MSVINEKQCSVPELFIRAVLFLHFLIFEVKRNGKDTFDQSRF